MSHEQPSDEAHRLPPLCLRGLTRIAFQPRSSPVGGLPPLGLTGRAPLPSFSIGTAGSEPVTRGRSGGVRRVGLSRPRPPPPNQAGPSNWANSTGWSGSSSSGNRPSTYVGFNFINGSGDISFGGTSTARGILFGGTSTGDGTPFGGTSTGDGIPFGDMSSGGGG